MRAYRKHEREQRESLKFRGHHEPEHMTTFRKDVRILKTVIMVGLVAAYFLPQDHAIVVGIASNLLWLWRT